MINNYYPYTLEEVIALYYSFKKKKKIMKPINVLSLFDGISCGRVALERVGIPINNYFASEIDKWAIKITLNNYPNTIEVGNVTDIDYTDGFLIYNNGNNYKEVGQIDLLCGGSPCQGFSFAGKQLNFNDPRSKLFFEFVRLYHECKPKYFLLENVKMKKESEDIISTELGVKLIKINSSLVSAQSRERLYWTNILGITQPKDKGIYLKDICLMTEHQMVIDSNYNNYMLKDKKTKRIDILEKNYNNKNINLKSVIIGDTPSKISRQCDRLYNINKKAPCLTCSLKDIKIDNNSSNKKDWFILSPIEWERLQTLPDNYTEGVTKNHRYHVIGNGWTVDVISHILSFAKFD